MRRICHAGVGLVAAYVFVLTAAAQQPAAVLVAPVEKRPIELASRLVATVEPMVSSTLAAEQSGLLMARHFDEGQTVEKGAVLAQLDDALLQRQLASAEASLRSSAAELRRAELNAQNLLRERDRITTLYEQGAATEKEYFDAINEHEQSVASVNVAEATLAEREAAVEELKIRIAQTQVVAPFRGVVNRRYVELGQWVQQGEPVAELVQLDPLYVRTGVPEGVLSRLKVGASGSFTVDALGGETFEGVVAEILPVANPESRTFSVRLRVDNPEGRLLPGMFARVTVRDQQEGALVVPKDAVVRSAQGVIVVVADNGTARIVPVQLGAADASSQAVIGDLKEGDLVVIRGNEGLMPGAPLMVQNAPGAGGQGPGGGPPGGGQGAGGPPPGAGQQQGGGNGNGAAGQEN